MAAGEMLLLYPAGNYSGVVFEIGLARQASTPPLTATYMHRGSWLGVAFDSAAVSSHTWASGPHTRAPFVEGEGTVAGREMAQDSVAAVSHHSHHSCRSTYMVLMDHWTGRVQAGIAFAVEDAWAYLARSCFVAEADGPSYTESR